MFFKTKTKKILGGAILALVCFSVSFSAQALGASLLSAVPIVGDQLGESLLNPSLGSAANITHMAIITADNAKCVIAETGADLTNSISNWNLGITSLIGENPTLVALLKAKIALIDKFIYCRDIVLADIKLYPGSSIYEVQQRQTITDEVNLAIQTLKKRKDGFEEQLKTASQGLWKAIVVKVLINLTKNVSRALVNSLTNTFKIRDVLGYTNVLASQVYSLELLQNNKGSNSDKAVLRSFIQNNQSSLGPSAAVTQKAKQNMGFDPATLAISDGNFYPKLATVGQGQNDPYTLNVIMKDQADTMKAQAQTSAQAEVSQGNGLKAPRDCSGSLSQQQAFDQKYDQLNKQVSDLSNLLQQLQDYKQTNGNLSADKVSQVNTDIVNAKTKLAAAQKALDDLPNTDSSFMKPVCEAITSPASLVDKALNSGFAAFDKNLSQYDNNNLPMMANLISDVVTQLGNSLIFGGNTKGTLLSEQSALTKIGAVSFSNAVNSSAIQFDVATTADPSILRLSWDASNVSGASYVVISGPELQVTKQWPVSGQTTVGLTAGTYTLTVFDKNNQNLGSSQVTIDNTQVAKISSAPAVAGAFTSKIPVSLRGPAEINLRGP